MRIVHSLIGIRRAIRFTYMQADRTILVLARFGLTPYYILTALISAISGSTMGTMDGRAWQQHVDSKNAQLISKYC